jgi:hypothetical protein
MPTWAGRKVVHMGPGLLSSDFVGVEKFYYTLHSFRGIFFKKGLKKILNSKKGCRFGKFLKMGTSRPIKGRAAWGRRLPPIQRAGGACSRIRKKIYLRRGTSRPINGREVPFRE